MTKNIFSIPLLLLILIISFSCSKNESIKKLTPVEITNFLLVNEQLPIKVLSNALEFPQDVIIGVNLGLIELNEDGKEKLKDVLENYAENGKNDFIKDNNEKKWSDFIKNDWIKSEITKISISKLNEIKDREFKNNALIQTKLNNFIPLYIERQTEELSSYQLSFFSKGFWINLGQISWMHIKSTFWGKFTNRDLHYLDRSYKKEFQQKWDKIYKSYFKTKDFEYEINNISKSHQFLAHIKHRYLLNLKSKKQVKSDVIYLHPLKLATNNINVEQIISVFDLTIVDDFGLMFLEILLGLLIATIINYSFRKIFQDEIRNHNQRELAITTLIKTGLSPLNTIITTGLFLGNLFLTTHILEKIHSRKRSISSKINFAIGFILLLISYWFFSDKKTYIENEINQNLKTNFSTSFDKTSIMILDELNLNTELFFTLL